MTQVDNPLKVLIASFSDLFAAWLLGQPPRRVRPLNVELPASTTRSDLVFEVIQVDGRIVLLHIELQGRRSHKPMPWRMLDYMTRLARREFGDTQPDASLRLHSVVIYTEPGAGANDTGHYELLGTGDAFSLAWRYEVVRLWQMEAEEILKLGQPAFLPLIGQSRLRQPEQILSQTLSQLRQVADEQQRGRLLTALMSLMRDEEVLKMVEKMLDASEELLLDTPYLQRIRQQGKEEGRLEGKAEGVLEGLREAILEAITLRFNPPAKDYRQISQQLEQLTERKPMQELHATAIEAEKIAIFTSRLAELLSAD